MNVEPADIVLEPVGSNTAPAAAVAALLAAARDADAMILILSSDHRIANNPGFFIALDKAAKVAAGGALVTFGITPTAPETGYGYIKRGAAIAGIEGCHEVAQFLEKLALAKAESMLQAGGFDWNSGMFMFRADRLLAEMRRLAPEVVLACERATAAARRNLSFIRLDAAAFGDSPSISIDYAVMEKTGRAAVVSADIGWSDVGSWSALWEHGQNQGDEKNNVTAGDVLLDDVSSSYIRAKRRMVAAVGVEDLIIVETGDAVLVAGRDKAQGVKRIVDRLRAGGRDEASQNPRVCRPWGHYEGMDHVNHFQVKRISVKPAQKLSLQMHHHRAEHWIVVEGTAKVTRNNETILLEENQSTYIPIGAWHRLENPGKIDLKLIKVQSGPYLGEDDIVRKEDEYSCDSDS